MLFFLVVMALLSHRISFYYRHIGLGNVTIKRYRLIQYMCGEFASFNLPSEFAHYKYYDNYSKFNQALEKFLQPEKFCIEYMEVLTLSFLVK